MSIRSFSPVFQIAGLLLCLDFAPCETNATDLSTTNRDCLRTFWEALERPEQPVTVLSFGDSMADSYQSINYCLITSLVSRQGTAGYSLNNCANATVFVVTNGASVLTPDSFWFSYHFPLPPRAALWWNNYNLTGGIRADKAGVYYVAQPGGGALQLSVSTNAGPWVSVMALDGYSPEPVGRFAPLHLPPSYYRLRVDGLSGTNIVIGSQLVDTHSKGVHIAFAEYPGIGLDLVTNVPTSIRIPILEALSPDLLIWHMKELGDEALRARLLENEAWWSQAAPNCSVLYIGTPWVSVDATSPITLDQNTVVRSIAVSHRRTYVDCMTPAVSYAWMQAQGYMVDGTHPNLRGSQYLANIAWDDLGLFAVGASLRLALEPAAFGLDLSFLTATGLSYTVESSSNLSDWAPVCSIPGNGGRFSTNWLPAIPAASYRLRLQPAR